MSQELFVELDHDGFAEQFSLPGSSEPLSFGSPGKHHSQEADELDFLCRKMSDVRVRNRPGVADDDVRLSDIVFYIYYRLFKWTFIY